MKRLGKGIVAGVAILVIGAAFYAKITDDLALQGVVAGALLLLVGAAWMLGMFERRKPQQKEAPAAGSPRPVTAARPARPPAPDELYLADAHILGISSGAAFRDWIVGRCEEAGLPVPSPSDVDRLAGILDARNAKAAAFRRTPGIALVRQARDGVDVTREGTSWLGGVPALGTVAWPRDARGVPMHFVAQIDLAGLPEGIDVPEGLPSDGALGFFVTTSGEGRPEGSVVHAPEGSLRRTPLPDDLPPIHDGPDWGYYVKGVPRDAAPLVFPRWPLEFVPLPMPKPRSDDAARAHMAALFPEQSKMRFSASAYRKTLPEFAVPFFWDTAQRVAHSMRIAWEDIDRTMGRLDEMAGRLPDGGAERRAANRADKAAFGDLVDEFSARAFSHDPWDRMGAADIARLEEVFRELRGGKNPNPRFAKFYEASSAGFSGLGDATDATLTAAATAAPEVHALLPDEIRSDLDVRHRLPGAGRWHQMFGLGMEIQTAVEEHDTDHLLLQLQSDGLLGWMWGDLGVIQFWMSTRALEQRAWDRVEVTFEGH